MKHTFSRFLSSILSLVFGWVMLSSAFGAQVLRDDFEGNGLSTAFWQILTPQNDAKMTQATGNAVFFQGGTLIGKLPLPAAIEIKGRFAFTGGSHDIFTVMLRTEGNLDPNYGVITNGVRAGFAQRGGDDGNQTGQRNVSITTGDGLTTSLAITNFLFEKNVAYEFKILDDGYNVQLFIQDMTTPLLNGSTSYVGGNTLGFQNRGFVPWWPLYDDSVTLDYIEVSSPPFVPSVSIAVSKIKVTQNVILGHTYVLETSNDLKSWADTGPQFTASSETIVTELDVTAIGHYFRLKETLAPNSEGAIGR